MSGAILVEPLTTSSIAATRSTADGCALLGRLGLFVGLALLFSGIAPQGAQAQSGYDPRTWSYDETQNVLISPSYSEPDSGYVDDRNRMPIPREIVASSEAQPKGSIVINTSERRLYYLMGNGKALRYAVGVGKDGLSWSGRDRISSKRQWPDWRPAAEMVAREAAKGRELPSYVEGGPNNPLGARALYIGSTLYRIHGTNQPWTVGQANSSGCIRMTNEDVIDLFERVDVGAQVIVRH
ncbi:MULTISPECIES: L,D-transpeptidase [unclassified Mesorhizobium]|uniref:L,D-transpeptidase n=1 Tax=unclassified Mesorhizobium TaxID=325217 RepID=UPI001FE1DCC3|nr:MULTISPECIES: L,D-transpeptidase [unclassified Mesorhizobium]